MEWFDDFDDQFHDTNRREKLTTLLSFGHGELAEEILVNLAEGVPLNRHRNRREVLEQRYQETFLQTVVRLWEDVLEIFVLDLNRLHGLVDGLADVRAFRQIQQRSESRLFGDVEDTLRLVVRLADLAATAGLLRHLLLGLGELVVGVAEEDEAQNRDRILRRLKLGVRPKFVGSFPKALFKISVICWHGSLSKVLILAGLKGHDFLLQRGVITLVTDNTRECGQTDGVLRPMFALVCARPRIGIAVLICRSASRYKSAGLSIGPKTPLIASQQYYHAHTRWLDPSRLE
jgi:hypothetical protein